MAMVSLVYQIVTQQALPSQYKFERQAWAEAWR
jgi:hypothetical protein